MEVKTHRLVGEDAFVLSAKVCMSDIVSTQVATSIMAKIASAIADKFVEENYAAIVAKLDQQAIANLAIADAAKKIAEEIQRRPTIVKEVEHHTAVYQKGLLGGLRRIG